MSLQSYLIMPIQRIPRYKMLLSDLLSHTPTTHPDHANLTSAVALVGGVAVHINEAVRAMENRRAIRTLEASFTESPEFLAPGRLLLHQGPLTKKSRGGDNIYDFFLFNDMLAYARRNPLGQRWSLHRKISVDGNFSVKALTHGTSYAGTPVAPFQVMSSQKSMEVYAGSEADKVQWLDALHLCVEEHQLKRRALLLHLQDHSGPSLTRHSLVSEVPLFC
jgi:hypothetical protein